MWYHFITLIRIFSCDCFRRSDLGDVAPEIKASERRTAVAIAGKCGARTHAEAHVAGSAFQNARDRGAQPSYIQRLKAVVSPFMKRFHRRVF